MVHDLSDRTDVVFDDERVVVNAGIVLAVTLGRRLPDADGVHVGLQRALLTAAAAPVCPPSRGFGDPLPFNRVLRETEELPCLVRLLVTHQPELSRGALVVIDLRRDAGRKVEPFGGGPDVGYGLPTQPRFFLHTPDGQPQVLG